MSEEERASGDLVIVNELGLHARAAVKLTQVAGKFPCEVTVRREAQGANGKSVMGLLLLCGGKGTTLTVEAVGPRAGEAVAAIQALVADKFGEGR